MSTPLIALADGRRVSIDEATDQAFELARSLDRSEVGRRDSAVALGWLLAQVKAALPHGAYRPFLRRVGLNYRHARMLVQTVRLACDEHGRVRFADLGLASDCSFDQVRRAVGTQGERPAGEDEDDDGAERVHAHTPHLGRHGRAPLGDAAVPQAEAAVPKPVDRWQRLTTNQQFAVMMGELDEEDCFDERGNHLPHIESRPEAASQTISVAPPAVGVVEANGPAAPTAIPCAESAVGERDSRQRHEQLTLDEIYQRADEVRAAIAVLMQRHERGEIADATERLERMLEIAAA